MLCGGSYTRFTLSLEGAFTITIFVGTREGGGKCSSVEIVSPSATIGQGSVHEGKATISGGKITLSLSMNITTNDDGEDLIR